MCVVCTVYVVCACVVVLCVQCSSGGGSGCLAPWECQGGLRAASAPERPQIGSEACRRGKCGAYEGLRGIGEAEGTQWVMRHTGGWKILQELWSIQEKQCDTQRVRIPQESLVHIQGIRKTLGGVMRHPWELWSTHKREIYGAQETLEAP